MRLIFGLIIILCPFQAFAACDVYGNCDDEDVEFFKQQSQKEKQDARHAQEEAWKQEHHAKFDRERTEIMDRMKAQTVQNPYAGRLDLTQGSFGLSGKIGDQDVSSAEIDKEGNISGMVNGERMNLEKDRIGALHGHIGTQSVTCYEDRIGIIDCN